MIKAKYLIYDKGRPMYQRRVPQQLKGHPQLPDSLIKKALAVDPADDAAVLKALKETSRKVDDWLAGLSGVNSDRLHRNELIQRAQAILEMNGLHVGDLADDPRLTEQENLEKKNAAWNVVESVGLISDLEDWSHKMAEQQIDETMLPPELKVQEMAWELLHKPDLAKKAHTFAGVWSYYKEKRGLEDDRYGKRIESRWKRFEEFAATPFISSDSVNRALKEYVEARHGCVKSSSVKRELREIHAAINLYVADHHDLDVIVRKPRLASSPVVERVALDQNPHKDLLAGVFALEDDWRKLALLIMCQSSLITSELMQLRQGDVMIEPILYLKVEEGKTEHRKRVVPLVVACEDIKRLVGLLAESGSLFIFPERVRATAESNWSHQLNRILKRITGNQGVTTYSLRHTWKANAERADISQTWMDRLGGWAEVSNKGLGYGRGASEFEENLKTAKKQQERVNKHLLGVGSDVKGGSLSAEIIPFRKA